MFDLYRNFRWATDDTAAQSGQQPAADADKSKTQAQAPADKKPADSGASGSKPEDSVPDWVKDPAAAYKALQDVRREAETHRKEAREAREALEKQEANKKKEEDAKLADEKKWEDLANKRKADLEKALAELQAEKLNNLRTRVGINAKLPAELIERLKGSTEDELKADAEALVKALGLDKAQEQAQQPPPKDNKSAGSRQTTAVAPGGQPAGETDDEKRARIYKRGAINSPAFKPRE